MEHTPHFTRHQLGCSPVSGHPLYGWSVRCSCGWKLSTNENKRRVESLHRQHVKTPAADPVAR